MKVKSYRELRARGDGPPGSAWGVFGKDDEVGTLNFLTPERVRAAAALVKRGAVFNLDHRLDAFTPALVPHREPPRHTIFSKSAHHRDDHIDNLFLQASSQIDGLRHFRHQEHGFYNYAAEDKIVAGSPTIGINRYAEFGIVGRGVLIDIERHLRKAGKRLDHRRGEGFPARLLDEVAAAQGVAFKPGDILLMRTGWLDFYFNELTADERIAFQRDPRSPGFDQSWDTPEWLWDHQISVAASDNLGLEAIPSRPDSPFVTARDRASGANPIHAGLMHPTLIALMGLCIGELWDLEALAADCAATGVYDSMVTVKPLNLTGGVGSPANALAIK